MLRLHNTHMVQCCHAANAYERLTYKLGGMARKQAFYMLGLCAAQNLPPIAAGMTGELACQ
jgi:hypothetical protein